MSVRDIDFCIYHGSPLLLSFIRSNPSDLFGGASVIFGSPFRWVAVSFCGRWTDGDIRQGTINGLPYMEEQYEGAFDKVYKGGGYVYTLSGDGFTSDKRLASFERYSTSIVLPIIRSERVLDPVEELKRLGVNMVYFKGWLFWGY